MTEGQTHRGSCHCGAVQFEVRSDLSGLVECNCSHCYRKGMVLAFTGRDQVSITQGEEATASYRFNKHNIDHRFCKTCGVQLFGFGTGPEGSPVAAINVRTLEDVEPWGWTAQRVDGRSF